MKIYLLIYKIFLETFYLWIYLHNYKTICRWSYISIYISTDLPANLSICSSIYAWTHSTIYKFTYKWIFLSSHSFKAKYILFCNFESDIFSAFCFGHISCASIANFIVQLTRNENAINLQQMQHLQCNSQNAFQFQLPIYNCDFHMNVKVNCPLAGAIFSCLGSWLCVCEYLLCVCVRCCL